MRPILFITALLLSCSSFAQGGGVSDLFKAKHIVKTNLVGYVGLAVNANYEYMAGENISVGLLGGYKLPQVIKVSAIGDLDGETMTYAGEVEPSGLFLNPYARFYPSGAMSGFYIELFTRYMDYDFTLPYDYIRDDNSEAVSSNLNGEFSAFGGGLGLGGQFSLAERVFLDINLGFGLASGNVFMETSDDGTLNAEDYQDIKREVEENRDEANVDFFLLGGVTDKIEVFGEADRAYATIDNQLFPILRGGISIGYAF